MTSEPTKSADTPPTTVWSNDVAGGGVVGDDLPGVAGIKEGEVSNTTATSSSKKKKKKKKQQQQQKEKAEEELKVGGDDDDEDVETPGITEVTKVSFEIGHLDIARSRSLVMGLFLAQV
jgi:hypothetical protein